MTDVTALNAIHPAGPIPCEPYHCYIYIRDYAPLHCAQLIWGEASDNEGPTKYVVKSKVHMPCAQNSSMQVPRGWYRFGLCVPARAAALEIFSEWSVSFHGVKSLKASTHIWC